MSASLRLGALPSEEGTTFRVWAPACGSVDVVVDGRRPAPLQRGDDGVWDATLGGVRAGARYRYRLDGERYRPDPVSRWQPEGVHGPSAVVDPLQFAWTDAGFAGHAAQDLVIYELHVGTYSTAGTFEGIVPHLPALVGLGITAIELMPVAEFPGSRNWGYDGVGLYAPQSTYGGPRGLRRLVDACHAAGVSVFVDLVYNHLGPEGNYLAEFGPYFTTRYQTPWGAAINFDGDDAEPVRRHFIDNARYWVREFHVDGLRLDAIHAIYDQSPTHILTEIAEGAREEARLLGRPVRIMAESHDNDRRIVLPATEGGIGLDAVWSDDFHHAVHCRLTGESAGYYCDFRDAGSLPRAIAQGFAYQGEASEYWGRPRGTPGGDLPAEAFVFCVQNHDQVGNRLAGDRLSTILPLPAVKLAAGLLFVSPAVPLLFMGEEYGETSPFQFFTSFLDPALSESVRRGRTQEFARFAWQGDVPDPTAPATFMRSRLSHALAEAPRHRELREYYRAWLGLRRTHPALGARHKDRTSADVDVSGMLLTVQRSAPSGPAVRLVANLGPDPVALPRPPSGWRVLIDSEDPRYAGTGPRVPLAPWQCVLYETG